MTNNYNNYNPHLLNNKFILNGHFDLKLHKQHVSVLNNYKGECHTEEYGLLLEKTLNV